MLPYSSNLVRREVLADGTAVTVRPIRREDAAMMQEFVRNLSDESRYFRFMDSLRELTPRMIAHFTQVDHDSHLALIAVSEAGGSETEVAVARYAVAADRRSCEFAVVVADEWQRRGLASRLMRMLIEAARDAGLALMYGEVLTTNARMLRFAGRLGFTVTQAGTDPRMVRIELQLAP